MYKKNIVIILISTLLLLTTLSAISTNASVTQQKIETTSINDNSGKIEIYTYYEGSSVSIPKALPNTKVELKSTDNTVTRTKRTNLFGECTFRNLPLNKTYNLTLSQSGFQERNKQVTLTEENNEASFNIRMYHKTKQKTLLNKPILNLKTLKELIFLIFPKLKI